jgi:beta-lactamase class D
VNEFFQKNEGTFVLKDLESGKMFIYNNERVKEQRTPNSTFKIMNSLIGLQVKAVKDEYEIKHWDGTKRTLDNWNQDHTLASGMRNSVVWYYQEMARDIGEGRMQEWLDRCSYGNRNISGGIDRFWLNSSLKISPLEQVNFLEGLYRETLPFDKGVMKTVKRIMIQQEGDEYILYGKTGSSGLEDGLSTGWFVGFVVIKGHPYVFAANLDSQEEIAGPVAKKVTIGILQKYNLVTR